VCSATALIIVSSIMDCKMATGATVVSTFSVRGEKKREQAQLLSLRRTSSFLTNKLQKFELCILIIRLTCFIRFILRMS